MIEGKKICLLIFLSLLMLFWLPGINLLRFKIPYQFAHLEYRRQLLWVHYMSVGAGYLKR